MLRMALPYFAPPEVRELWPTWTIEQQEAWLDSWMKLRQLLKSNPITDRIQ